MAVVALKSSATVKAAKWVCSLGLQKNVPVLFMLTRQESSLPPLKTERLNQNIQLRTIQEASARPRPLVLLFGWMLAKQRHLDKYGNLYHSKGFDVLSLQMKPTQVLLPTRAQRAIDELLAILQDSSLNQKPLMIHGFSVGGYMYGEMLVKLSQDPEKYKNVRSRMVGQVFDSPVDFEGVPHGFASVLVKNKLAQKALRSTLEGYLSVFKKPITSHYLRSSAAFHKNEFRMPSLMLYSRSDPIGVDTAIEQVMKKWKAAGIPVTGRCWESSPHVSHFHRHPDEYVEAVLRFLDSIGLTQPEVTKVTPKRDAKKTQEAQRAL